MSIGNIYHQKSLITRNNREVLNAHKSFIVWFTGLSGSGKSTLAFALEERLHLQNYRTYVIDGDNLRHGLSSDLGFSNDDRRENIRRAGETAKILIDAGIITFAAFISPMLSDRSLIRSMVSDGEFIEIYCAAQVEVCERRDIKGLYVKARKGIIKNFTGINAPYEPPVTPELIVQTGELTINQSVEQILSFLRSRDLLSKEPNNEL